MFRMVFVVGIAVVPELRQRMSAIHKRRRHSLRRGRRRTEATNVERGTSVRLAYGTVLFVILSLTAISPLEAAPQIGPPVGELVVTVTSPDSGSTVTSTITV